MPTTEQLLTDAIDTLQEARAGLGSDQEKPLSLPTARTRSGVGTP